MREGSSEIVVRNALSKSREKPSSTRRQLLLHLYCSQIFSWTPRKRCFLARASLVQMTSIVDPAECLAQPTSLLANG